MRAGGKFRPGESPNSEGPGHVTILLQPEGGERVSVQATTTDAGLVEFVPQSAREILALLDSAESQARPVRLSVDAPNRAVAEFAVAGLRSAIATLPCAQR